MKHRFLNFLLVVPILLALTFGAVNVMPAYAAGAIVVNSASDTIADDGACTLREAITNAIGDSQLYVTSGECATGSGDDAITFAADYTITVGSQLPEVTSANGTVTITGNGSANTILQASTCNPITLIDSVTSGSCTAATDRVFRVASGATATLEALTIRYGSSPAGGAIITSGSLTLNTVIVRDSQAPTLNGGAIVAKDGGKLTLNNSIVTGNQTVSGNGGGIYQNFASVTLNNSTVSGNSATGHGGGLYNNIGTLNITNSTFSGNTATGDGGGLYHNNGTLTVTDSTFSGGSADQGGGIFNTNSGVLDVTNSAFSSNIANVGGGIANEGQAVVEISTFSGNSATTSGGGLYNNGAVTVTGSTFSGNSSEMGGGSTNDDAGTLTVANSTFSSNRARGGTFNVGGGISNFGTLTALNITFSGNNADTTGGGIYSTGSATVKNTLMVKGTAGDNCSGTLNGTANAADDGSCGTSFANTPNLRLGTLGNYGGSTQIIPLLAFSDAINFGDNATCVADPVSGKDQRGKARDTACDMGAYEFEFSQVGTTFTVTTATDHDDNACSDADCTLREAINAANANSDANTIAFAANYTITLGSQLPAVTTSITINGNGAANSIVQASDCNPVTLPSNCTPATYRVFEVSATGDLTLNDLTVQNGTCSGLCATSGSRGGGVYNAGTMTISNADIRQNSANNNGGGMYNALGSNATLTNVTFSANLGAGAYGGGGMANNGSNPILTNVTFSGNSAGGTTYDGLGGGMFNYGSSPQLTNVTFSQNSTNTYGYGGGMYNDNNSSPTLTNVTFSGNTAGLGGGMFNSNSSPALTEVLFSANNSLKGGGMYNENNSSPTLTNVTISGNTAASQGGGMYNNSNPTLINVTFSGNSASDGGGINNGSGVPTLTNTIIANSLSGGDCSGTLNAASAYNLIEGNSCGLTNGANGNIVGKDPMLDILADNGGFTQTHALLAGSPAINAGTITGCPSTDQRGGKRPQGATCDIGAYEYTMYQLFLPLLLR